MPASIEAASGKIRKRIGARIVEKPGTRRCAIA
jgi:hypothetical protein